MEDDGTQVRASAAQRGSSDVIDSARPRNVAADSPALKGPIERRADRRADVVLHVGREDGELIGFKGVCFRYALSVFTTRRAARLNPSTLWAVSTFFGGHDKEWATPKDQFVWFKDFELSVNDLE